VGAGAALQAPSASATNGQCGWIRIANRAAI
jgi:hypothetical protein